MTRLRSLQAALGTRLAPSSPACMWGRSDRSAPQHGRPGPERSTASQDSGSFLFIMTYVHEREPWGRGVSRFEAMMAVGRMIQPAHSNTLRRSCFSALELLLGAHLLNPQGDVVWMFADDACACHAHIYAHTCCLKKINAVPSIKERFSFFYPLLQVHHIFMIAGTQQQHVGRDVD